MGKSLLAAAAFAATAAIIIIVVLVTGVQQHVGSTSLPRVNGQHQLAGRFGGPPPSDPAVGDVLFTDGGKWSGSPTGFAYQWKDCDSNGANCVTAAGSPTNTTRYQIASGDTGFTIRVAVTASYSGHPDSTVMSQPTGIVGGAQITAFNDTMNGSSIATGPNQWTTVDNTVGNTNSYTCDAASQDSETGGNMVETIVGGSFSCPGVSNGVIACSSGTCSSVPFKAGEVHARDQAFKYGTVTYTGKFMGGGGSWAAVWLLGDFCQHPQFLVVGADPAPCNWPNGGSSELDITEFVQSVTSFKVNYFPGGMICNPAITDVSANSHNYELDWSASSTVVKVDGTAKCTTGATSSDLMFPLISQQMASTGTPTATTNTIDSLTITPAGPDITSSGNWPSISGSTVHGNTLTAATGTWTGSPTSYAYQWMQCDSSGNSCSPITSGSGCTSTWDSCGSTYTTVAGDVGHKIQVLVTATNASGATQYGSNPVGAIT